MTVPADSTRAMNKADFVCAIAVAVIIFSLRAPTTLTAQAGDPSKLPLLSSGGLEYVGGFRVPAEAVNGLSFLYGGQAVAHDAATNTLFISSNNSVAEVSIPTPVDSSDVDALPFASFLQPFNDPTEGHLREVNDGDVKMDSLMVYGSRLYGTAYIYFDASNVQRVSHYSRSRQLNQQSFSGWSQVWETGGSGFVAGMMAAVPSEWQAKLGGPAITGQCCIPIIYRTSSGPSALAFDPSKVGQASVSATALLYYPQDHATLGSWSNVETINPSFNMGTEIWAWPLLRARVRCSISGRAAWARAATAPARAIRRWSAHSPPMAASRIATTRRMATRGRTPTRIGIRSGPTI